MGPRRIQNLISLLAVALLGSACFWTLRLGYADRLFYTGSLEGVKRAAELVPDNGRYLARWAAMLDQSENDRRASLAALAAAVACNPRDASSWIELGLRAEMDGDFAKAESNLLEAARVDKQYGPQWALVNFYFRRNDAEKFWVWAREAAAMSFGDATPLYRLCWRFVKDPAVILNRAIPDQPQSLLRYLEFLLADDLLDALEPVGQRVAERASQHDLPVLFASCDRLLGARRLPGALRIWNALCQRGLVPYQALEPEKGLSLTNPDFAALPVSHGFDWRLHNPQGVSWSRGESPPLLRITFSGKQPESCEILGQLVPVLPGKQYGLGFRYRTFGIAPDTGLRWRVFDAMTSAELGSPSRDLSNEQEAEDVLMLLTPAGTRLVRVVLMYQRTLGTTRIEGSVSLRRVRLEFASTAAK